MLNIFKVGNVTYHQESTSVLMYKQGRIQGGLWELKHVPFQSIKMNLPMVKVQVSNDRFKTLQESIPISKVVTTSQRQCQLCDSLVIPPRNN